MNYQGVCCPVCGKPFQEGDDIVVCPECGAPHHRECYKSLGHCALQDELHQEGLSWQNPNDQRPQHQAQRDGVQPDQNGNIICPNCGLFCHEEDQFCPNCRFPLHQAPRVDRPVVENPFEGEEVSDTGFADMFEAIYADDELDGIPAKDFIFIVRQNYIYFLRVFKIFSQRAKAKIFNWSSFLFGFLYFFYRKMYKIGSILLGIYLLTNIPSLILSFHMLRQTIADPMLVTSLQYDFTGLEGLQILSQLLTYARLGLAVFVGFTANHFYYKHCRQKIEKLRGLSSGGSENEYYQTLSSVGGVSALAVFVVLALLLGLTFLSGTVMMVLL